ncbi:hypothetical protein EYF80_064991 [Liparis tanakae]|uniref:Uncharacterized protein n=1 Tax=Liparis tanakae TaxID=230148 RepID=A0A4Z2E890_9TELE|nr:hypothetical protein EYF80_064991 [Liparis tanakae]
MTETAPLEGTPPGAERLPMAFPRVAWSG